MHRIRKDCEFISGLFAHLLVLALMAIRSLGPHLGADFLTVMSVIRVSQRRSDHRFHHIVIEQSLVRVNVE
jgi:hypothetical protein